MVRFTEEISRSLREYLLISGKQIKGVTPDTVQLGGNFGGYDSEELEMPLAMFSAAMQCVSGDKLGIALAQYGGCAVLPRSLSVDDQVYLGKRVKKEKAGFNRDVITVSPGICVQELMDLSEETGYSSFPVVDDKGVLMGLMTEKRYHPGKDGSRKVSEKMIPIKDVITASAGTSLVDANDKILSYGLGILPIIDSDEKFQAAVFWQDIQKDASYPNNFVDGQGRYMFAGALSTFNEDFERADALVEAGCDILMVDTADLKSEHAETMVRGLKTRHKEMPLVAGNVIDAEGFLLAADAGADMVKIGQGPGYGCTTREVKRSGRGQATAINEVANARNAYEQKNGRRVPICADGGMEHTGDMIIALALGADFLMMGKYFGEFTESAAPTRRVMKDIDVSGRNISTPVIFKEYWGEASERAANVQRYGYKTLKDFVPEGAEGLIPHTGSIHDNKHGIQIDIAFLKKTLSESGAENPQEFSERTTLERQSDGSMSEGRSKV